jgi:branched-chain amino acid transport system ATP-binding protein
MLNVKNLNSGYGKMQVLKDVDIEVKSGEIVALIGPNGSGKTTVIKSIFGIADVFEGMIHFKKENVKKLKTHDLIRRGVSYVPQGRIVFEDMTIKENLEMGARFIDDKEVVAQQLKEVYGLFPILKERENKKAYQLSGGQRQMLALGRALIQKPNLLMLDEPSIGLSPKLQKQLFDILLKLRDKGIALLIVEQNAKKAIEMADRTYLLENGEIALTGGKDIIKHKKIKEVYLGG